MKKLSAYLSNLEYTLLSGTDDIDITEPVFDSRKISEGCLFICIKGAKFDGHSCFDEAIQKGASAIVVQEPFELPDYDTSIGAAVVSVPDTRRALAEISCEYFNHPAKSLKTIGITGTKGKTTTTYLIRSILQNAGYKVGLIGTIETIIGDEHIPSVNTTPESYVLQSYLRKMADAGCDAVVMEVSSQALMMHRTAGFTYDIGIFTNIEPDHIGPNEHESFEQYLHCKSLLFRQCKVGIVNGDDPHSKYIMDNGTCDFISYGFDDTNDMYAADVKMVNAGGELGVSFAIKGRYDMTVSVNMPGKFSIYNALCAVAVCKCFEVSKEQIAAALLKARVKGRIELVKVSDEFALMIDYAHNAMALESLLSTLKEYEHNRIVCLFGCGGNRAKSRRFEMGEVSGRLADLTVITSDNPRDEDPMDIISDIKFGIQKTDGIYVEIPDRKEAIRYCIENGRPGDIVVLAGKGHEDYQEIKGVKYPMDERVLIAEILEEIK